MSSKFIISSGMLIGSVIGGFIPNLWGSDLLSFSSILFSTIGGALGIWIGFEISR